jgi:hypothetical protein
MCGAGYIFLPFPLDSDTVEGYQHHRCSCQSRVLNTAAVQNGGCYGRTRQRLNISLRKCQSDRNSQTLRSVYGGDAMYVSSDAGSVSLRVVKRTLLTVLTRSTSCAATSGTVKEPVSGILGERCHNPERHVRILQRLKQRIRRIQQSRKKNQVLLLHDNARQHTVCAQGGNCHYGVDCFLSSSLQSRFNTLRFPAFSHPEGCNPRVPFCGRRAEIQNA